MSYFVFDSRLCARADARLDNDTVRTLWQGFCFRAGQLSLSRGEENSFAAGDAAVPAVPAGKEFALCVTPTGIAVAGQDYAGLVRGLMTLMQRIEAVDLEEGRERFRNACCALESTYSIRTRMIHFCIFPETTRAFMTKCIRLAGAMQYTHVILEFWGMLRYDCLSELAWPCAWSKDFVRGLIREIRDLGMEPVPMINHLGHATASRVSGGKHVVLDQNPRLALLFSEDGWSWNIRTEKAKALLRAMRAELYELFGDGEYIHLGCDEVYSYETGEENHRLMREYLGGLIRETAAEGRRPILWGDMFLNRAAVGLTGDDRGYACNCDTPAHAQAFLDELPREAVIADWHYSVLQAPVKTSVYLKAHGFEVLGAPWYEPKNGQAHADTVRENGLLGVMVTTWHTLAAHMPQIVTEALQMGAYHAPWSGDRGIELRTETAALCRKIFFVNGDYEEAGWVDEQIIKRVN